MNDSGKRVLCAAATLTMMVSGVFAPAFAEDTDKAPDAVSTNTLMTTPNSSSTTATTVEIVPTTVNLPHKAAFVTWSDTSVKPWASILAIHGLGFHKETYEPLARKLARIGIVVYALDVRGFGVWQYSEDSRVNFDRTFDDIKEGLEVIHERHKGMPVFLLGESMGGSIVLQAAARDPQLVDGVIASVPAGNSKYTLPTIVKMVVAGLIGGANAQIDIGKIVIPNATENEGLKNKLRNDPRQRQRLRVKDLMKFRKLAANNNKAAKKIDHTPVLIVQGYKDKLVSTKSIFKTFNKVATDKKSLVYKGVASHLILEEGQFDDSIVDGIVSFMDRNSAESPIMTASEIIKQREANSPRPIVDKPGIQTR